MLRYLTGGESHGPLLTAVLDGMPSNLPLSEERIGNMLRLRQTGYGRGARQAIERDAVRIVSGVRDGVTLGTPITLLVENRDYENWAPYMDAWHADTSARRVTAVRPGHADLVGCMKYGHTDARNVLERASARETAARVAVGAVCRELLYNLGVRTAAYVVEIGGVADTREHSFEEALGADSSPLRVLDAEAEREMIARIRQAKEAGDTLGGRIRVLVSGLKPGLGSFTQYDRKFDAALAAAVMSIQAVKGVEIGLGFGYAATPGSAAMDEIFPEGGERPARRTNRAGGIEGGMTNGEDVVVTLVMKPIPTLMSPLSTVDIATGLPARASSERSDVCAVTACSVVAEAAVAFECAKFILEAAGASNFTEIEKLWNRSKCL